MAKPIPPSRVVLPSGAGRAHRPSLRPVAGFAFDASLREGIAGNLAGLERRALELPSLRHAAVALVLVGAGDGSPAALLLTRRTSRLARHSGQYALPGGRLDQGEDAPGAALRELREELGLTLERDEVLGALDDLPTRSGFRITPVVVWEGRGRALRPSASEVDCVYRIPLAELDESVPRFDHLPGCEHPVLSLPLPTLGHDLYAPTAAVVYQFRELALRGRPTRVSQYEAPLFAWR